MGQEQIEKGTSAAASQACGFEVKVVGKKCEIAASDTPEVEIVDLLDQLLENDEVVDEMFAGAELDQLLENDEAVDEMFAEAVRNTTADVETDEMMTRAEHKSFVDSLFL